MRLLTVGRIDDEKGQLIIPEVVKLLRENHVDIRWYCIEEGPLEIYLGGDCKYGR